ncbi:hypothetical protein GHT06_004503 [Daphnia sinensis]|uniref:Uncharacterized protein n=1 Tax=Daphnia sinensis TaxID=1820382 RepID=A0AAD5L2T9_9CRUS|nr:hypothetical protein GHT06_004503 [Daphnia sinensis]
MKTIKITLITLGLLVLSVAASYAQIKIGTHPTTINTSSILEVESTNKGVLLPRIALQSADLAAPLASHVAGMIVYNTATAEIFDATTTSKGVIQLAGDLTGTAAAPVIATGKITSDKILDGTIATIDLANDAVTTAKILNANVTTDKIADANVTTAKIADANVTTAKIASGAEDIATGAVTTDQILDGTVATVDLANNAVTTDKISNGTIKNEDLNKTDIPLSGFAAAAANVDLGSNKLVNVLDPTAAQDAATKKYVDDATTAINTLADGKIYIGNSSNEATEVTMTGDVTISNAGVTTIGASKVLTGMIADANVTEDKLAADAVTSAKIKDGTIVVADLADNAVETAKIKDAAVTTAKILDANVTTAKIAPSATNNSVLTTDNTGAVTWLAASNSLDITTTPGKLSSTVNGIKSNEVNVLSSADNGLTVTNGNVQLGGTLTAATTITTDANNTLALAGLQDGANTDKMLVVDANGVIKTTSGRNVLEIVNQTANYTVTDTDHTILANLTGGAFTITLPAASAANKGRVILIRKTDESNNVLTFSQSIKYSETTSITTLNYLSTIRIQSDGTACYGALAQTATTTSSQKIGANPTSISPSAVLEVESDNKGVLFPRIALGSSTDVSKIASPVTGLTIFNTATAGTSPNAVTPGYYYWNGSKWVKIAIETPFAKTVYVNAASPSTATIFDENNPPATNNNDLNASDNNVYIGNDGSTWTYDPSSSTYKTYLVPASTPFNLAGTTTDAGKDKTSAIWRTGGVGIGINNPSATLHVQNSTVSTYNSVAKFLAPSNTTAGNATQLNFGTAGAKGNSSEWRFVYQGNDAANNRVDFGMSGYITPMISYLRSGNVGIGISNPVATLDVNSPTAATQAPNADVTILKLSRPTSSGTKFGNVAQFNLGTYAQLGATAYSRMDLTMNDGLDVSTMSPVMTWQANGFVGVGINAPTVNLDVKGGAIGTKHVFTIDGSGSVGIGTTSPTSTIHAINPLAATKTVNADAQVLRISRPATSGQNGIISLSLI